MSSAPAYEVAPPPARGGTSVALGALLGAILCRLGGVGDDDKVVVVVVIFVVAPLQLLASSARVRCLPRDPRPVPLIDALFARDNVVVRRCRVFVSRRDKGEGEGEYQVQVARHGEGPRGREGGEALLEDGLGPQRKRKWQRRW